MPDSSDHLEADHTSVHSIAPDFPYPTPKIRNAFAGQVLTEGIQATYDSRKISGLESRPLRSFYLVFPRILKPNVPVALGPG